MERHASLDALVRQQLRRWPQALPGFAGRGTPQATSLRARPSEQDAPASPFLKIPGTDRLRTLPDGMWLQFGGTAAEPWCDVVAIEACSSFQNLLDKRSRFAPSTHSLLAICPLPWLAGPVSPDDPTPRWRLTGILDTAPTGPLTLPVRDLRVLYGLKDRHFDTFATGQIPHAHEFFCPIGALTRERGYDEPRMRALMSRLSAANNFLDPGP